MSEEIQDVSIEKRLREFGVPCPWVKGLCVQGGQLLAEFSSTVSEMERIYSLPGIEMKWGERARDTLRKGFDEKYGMEISVGRFIIAVENKFPVFKERLHLIEFVFEIKSQSSDFLVKAPQIDLKWLDMNEINRYNFQPKELQEALFSQNLYRLKHMIAGDLKFVK